MATDTLDRAGGEPARAGARGRPPGRAALADPDQRGAGADPGARRRPGEPRLPDHHAADPVQGRRTTAPACGGASRTCAARRPRRSPRATTRSSCPTAATTRRTRRSRRCSPSPAVHHHLVRDGTRGRVGLVLESGEPREAHHFACYRLRGRGDQPVPRLRDHRTTRSGGPIPGPVEAAEKRYRKAATKGVIKAISRMGISTVHSYHGAQVFEAIGLNQDFVDEYFTWTPSPDRRHRHRGRDRQRGQAAPGPRLPAARPIDAHAASRRAASTSTAPTARTTCSTR